MAQEVEQLELGPALLLSALLDQQESFLTAAVTNVVSDNSTA